VRLKNSLDGLSIPEPKVPDELSAKISLKFTTTLEEREAKLFHHCMVGLLEQLTWEGVNIQNLSKATIIFTNEVELCIEHLTENYFGYCLRLIVYRVNLWRDRNYSDFRLVLLYLEELCHHYFNIEDEELTKIKVVEIVNRKFNPDVTFDEIYRPDWKSFYEDYED